jgi:hypothetical protein
MRSSRRRALRFLLVFITIAAWFLSGWPQVFNLPPKIREAQAADYDVTDDFETDWGNWADVNGTCYWQRHTGDLGSSSTGADNDHTYGDTTHYKISVECSSSVCQGTDTEAVTERNIDGSSYTLSLEIWYHMYGSGIGTMHVDIYDGTWNNDLWSISGAQHSSETEAFSSHTVDLSSYSSATKVRIRYDGVSSYAGDIALDDLRVYGDLRNTAPNAPTLHDVPFDNEKIGDSTPNFEFTASDPDGTDQLSYHIQIDDDTDFLADLVIECDSNTTCATGGGSWDAGGDTTDPFAEDVKMTFTATTTLSNNTTYYWRVRAEDSISWGGWTSTQSFTVVTGTDPSEWFQTTDEQFDTGTLSSTQTSGSDSVELGGGGATIIYLTSGTTWDVPNDWNSSNNSIEVIGAGGNGGLATDSTNSGGGGGGGEYRKVTNVSLTASSTVNINIPSGGDGSSADGAWIKNNSGTIVVEAKNGGNASGVTAGSGGTGGSCLGGCAANNDGGAGGIGGSAAEAAGGGGGGSAGPSGAGKDGGDGYGGTDRGGGGGGGSNGGSSTAGETPTGGDGGQGGHGTSGTGGGAGGIGVTSGDAPGEDGTNGGGGGGGGYTRSDGDDPGGSGSCDTTWDSTHGACGGGGGAGSASGTGGTGDKDGGPGGTYGGGGGGCGMSGTLDSGECDGTGVGGQGIIVITYAPDASSGTIMSTEIDFDWVADATSWSQVDWTEDETNGIVTLQVYYTASTACDTIIPNTDLSGNSTGFASGPIDISGLNTTTYNRICLKATLTDDNGTPYLNDWTVKWSSGAVVSVSVSDGVVTYDIMPENTSKSTLSGELNDMQTATNDGNVTENFNIKGQDATGGGCTWTLASSNGSNQYVHQFCNDTDLDCSSPPTNYTALTTSYQTLDTGITASGEVDFQLRLTTPNPSSCYGQQSVDVTIQAVQ